MWRVQRERTIEARLLKLNSQIEFIHNLEPIKFYLKCVQSSESI